MLLLGFALGVPTGGFAMWLLRKRAPGELRWSVELLAQDVRSALTHLQLIGSRRVEEIICDLKHDLAHVTEALDRIDPPKRVRTPW